jgi:hypothetical protein
MAELDVLNAASWTVDETRANIAYLAAKGDTSAISYVLQIRGDVAGLGTMEGTMRTRHNTDISQRR